MARPPAADTGLRIGAASAALATGDPEVRERAAQATDSSFAQLIEQLSEPGGYFDTDNLISNEASYLHVMGTLDDLEVRGGAYIGVGPDQNFSYIAQVRPAIAFIIDIRRDNLLEHLLFKSVFGLARNRLEYLCLLFGRPVPDDPSAWNRREIEELVAYLDGASRTAAAGAAARAAVRQAVRRIGVPLTPSDLETIERFHTAFIAAGLDLRFTSHNRPPRPYYPTYRRLLLETDLAGQRANYLVDEADFQFVKRLQEQDLVIPVVGDLAGDHALAAVGRYVARQGMPVSAFYTSNVEFYLMREGNFARFAENVRTLPRRANSVVIRSYFGGAFGYSHPQSVRGYYSTQLLQTLQSLVAEYERGGYRTYLDVVNKHALDLR